MRVMRISGPMVLVLGVQLLFVAACALLFIVECAPHKMSCPGSDVRSAAALAASQVDKFHPFVDGAESGQPRQTIFVITPTFNRLTQKLDLTRLSHTLFVAATRHRIHWIVIEDATERSDLVEGVLARSGLRYTHLHKKEKHIAHHFKGGEPRNEGIRHVRALNPPAHPESVIYFADDDNAYDAQLFDELVTITTIGVFPVGYSGARRAEFPVVQHGRVVGFEAYLSDARKFPMDMAGFAISIKYFLRPAPLLFQVNAPKTTGETRLLEAAGAEWHTLQPLSANCTKVLVWHVKSLVPFTSFEPSPDQHILEV